jgi:hypothetical protein
MGKMEHVVHLDAAPNTIASPYSACPSYRPEKDVKKRFTTDVTEVTCKACKRTIVYKNKSK